MSRTGKIARLPRTIRHQLNHRLADGDTGPRLAAWLNSLPEVRHVLDRDFGGRPINEQNLSEWRQGGFEDWLRHEDASAWATQLTEESDELDQASGSRSLSERALYPALLALSGLLRQVIVSADPVEQRRSVISAAHQLTQLRRAFLQGERLRLERERWEFAKETIRSRSARQAEHLRLAKESAERLKEDARQDALFRAQYVPDLHPDQWPAAAATAETDPCPSQKYPNSPTSDPPKSPKIKANQTTSDQKPTPQKPSPPPRTATRQCRGIQRRQRSTPRRPRSRHRPHPSAFSTPRAT